MLKKYQEAALRTESTCFGAMNERLRSVRTLRLLHAAMGLADEAGEFVKPLKAHIFYGQELDLTSLEEELGDVCWFLALSLDALGLSWEACLAKNLAKLNARYGEAFSLEAAVRRDLRAERAAMEEDK